MRHALVAGALALLLSGSFGIASAAETGHAAPAVIASAANADSPDVAQWTSHLIVNAKTSPLKRGQIRTFAGGVLARTSKIASALTRSALRFLGVPYVFGGTSASGFDCSGYVQHVFAMMGVHLPRTADAQYYDAHAIHGQPRAGDLVFFQTYTEGPSHVGIYLGSGRFVHASSSHGVMVSSLSDSYWSAHYIGAKRPVSSIQ